MVMRLGQSQPMGWVPSVGQRPHGQAGTGLQHRRRDGLRDLLVQDMIES